jgi:hypothetical protein
MVEFRVPMTAAWVRYVRRVARAARCSENDMMRIIALLWVSTQERETFKVCIPKTIIEIGEAISVAHQYRDRLN